MPYKKGRSKAQSLQRRLSQNLRKDSAWKESELSPICPLPDKVLPGRDCVLPGCGALNKKAGKQQSWHRDHSLSCLPFVPFFVSLNLIARDFFSQTLWPQASQLLQSSFCLESNMSKIHNNNEFGPTNFAYQRRALFWRVLSLTQDFQSHQIHIMNFFDQERQF